jgi:hypothetical protein
MKRLFLLLAVSAVLFLAGGQVFAKVLGKDFDLTVKTGLSNKAVLHDYQYSYYYPETGITNSYSKKISEGRTNIAPASIEVHIYPFNQIKNLGLGIGISRSAHLFEAIDPYLTAKYKLLPLNKSQTWYLYPFLNFGLSAKIGKYQSYYAFRGNDVDMKQEGIGYFWALGMGANLNHWTHELFIKQSRYTLKGSIDFDAYHSYPYYYYETHINIEDKITVFEIGYSVGYRFSL